MLPNRHSISAVATAKKLNTPLKASVVILTSVILAACGSSGSDSYTLNDIFPPTAIPGGGVSSEELEAAKAEAEAARKEAEAAKAEAAAKVAAAEKAAAEKVEAANKAKLEAEQATAAAEKAAAEALVAQKEAEQALEDALESGGGSQALQDIADRKAEIAAQAAATAQAAAEAEAQAIAEAQVKVAEAEAANAAATQAAADAAIKNAAETAKTGVQHISIDASGLGQGALVTTTRDFQITDETQVQARADIASNGLVSSPVTLKISGDSDAEVASSNGFKSFENTTKVVTASLGEQDLVYTSTYKDFGDELRVAHIDGAAAGLLPVNGVAVVGNATQAANMPTDGSIKYSGDATYRKTGAGQVIEFGQSAFTADFVAKKVAGALTFANAGNIGLEADITGNKFTGTKDGYKADGGFFGGDGQYLGGVYEGKGAQGTYGAKSDKQTAADKLAQEAAARAEATEQALSDAQAQASQAQAAAAQAQANAVKAAEEARIAQEAADNATTGGNEQALQDALDRAEAAEAAAQKAQAEAAAAIKAATEKAQAEVKAAQDKAEAAQLETDAAREAAAAAQAQAEAAKQEAAAKIAAVETAAAADVEAAKAEAEQAKADAAKAQADLQQAQADIQDAETRAATALAAQTAAELRAQQLQEQLDALNNPSAYQSDAEVELSGAQHLSIDGTALGAGALTTTTRDFAIRSNSDADARADVVLEGVVDAPVAITLSGDNDSDTANGFKSHAGTGNVLGEGDLAYTSIYKDFGDNGELRVAHVDGAVSALGTTVPVDGVLVIGNKTATLPTEGTFEYAGDATNRKVGVDNAIEYGSSEFTADFVASRVDGTLKFAQAGEIGLSANITDNQFSGTAANSNGYNSEGAFYGKDANYIGGIYEGNGSQGTFGAEKDGTPADLVVPEPALPEPPVNPDFAPDTELTGFQSNTLSSVAGFFTQDAIGYAEIRDDKSDFTETVDVDGSQVPVDNRAGDNFTNYDSFLARADMTKPDSVKEAVEVNLTATDAADYGNGFSLHTESTKVQGPVALNLDYSSVYRNFDSQMQIGHVYGDPKLGTSSLARVSNVYVQGNGTSLEDMQYMKDLAQYNIDNNINDGMVAYAGVATYMENLHLKEGARGGPVVDGTSNFNVDFVNSKLEGTLTFADGNYNYMPAGNAININADISGNTFAGNVGNIDTAGGFYGEDAQFLGGVYQEALTRGGKGAQPGEGTTFQGTFGAEKQ